MSSQLASRPYSAAGTGLGGFASSEQTLPGVTWRQVADKVRGLVQTHLDDELKYIAYTPFAAQDAATVCAERLMIAIREITRNDFKLVVNVQVLQKGGGLHTVSSCYWDSIHDGSTVIRYENESIIAVATVYGIRLE